MFHLQLIRQRIVTSFGLDGPLCSSLKLGGSFDFLVGYSLAPDRVLIPGCQVPGPEGPGTKADYQGDRSDLKI